MKYDVREENSQSNMITEGGATKIVLILGMVLVTTNCRLWMTCIPARRNCGYNEDIDDWTLATIAMVPGGAERSSHTANGSQRQPKHGLTSAPPPSYCNYYLNNLPRFIYLYPWIPSHPLAMADEVRSPINLFCVHGTSSAHANNLRALPRRSSFSKHVGAITPVFLRR